TDWIGGVASAGSNATRERLRTPTSAIRPELAAALAATGAAQAQLVISPSEDQRRIVTELFPKIPPELGGRPTADLIQGTRWATVAADVTPKLTIKLLVQAKDEKTAKDLNALVGAGFLAARMAPNVRRQVPFVDQLTAALRPQVEG